MELVAKLSVEIEVKVLLRNLDGVQGHEGAVGYVLNHVLGHDLHCLQIFFSLEPPVL